MRAERISFFLNSPSFPRTLTTPPFPLPHPTFFFIHLHLTLFYFSLFPKVPFIPSQCLSPRVSSNSLAQGCVDLPALSALLLPVIRIGPGLGMYRAAEQTLRKRIASSRKTKCCFRSADSDAVAANFPGSAAFDAINAALSASEADRKDAIKQANAIFAFTLKNKAGETASWNLDLKNAGKVSEGLGEKPTVTLSLSDDDFVALAAGKANAQRLFMSGKLKIKGDIMKSSKLEPILKKAQTKAKL